MKKTCLLCNSIFIVPNCREKQKYCSKECVNKSKIGVKRIFSKEHCEKLKKVKHTEEWNKKVSQALKCKIVKEETKNKISKTLTGRKRPIEECIKISNSMKNSFLVQEHLKQLNVCGEKAPNWQGGLSFEEYGKEFDNKLKEQIRFRDNYKCRKCGCSQIENGRQLDVHHIDYDKNNANCSNLISLCRSCHMKTNRRDRKICTEEFQYDMS